jgi:hypothetical protein
MKGEKDDDVGKALQVLEAGGELIEDEELPLQPVEEAGWGEARRRDVLRVLEGRPDDAGRSYSLTGVSHFS